MVVHLEHAAAAGAAVVRAVGLERAALAAHAAPATELALHERLAARKQLGVDLAQPVARHERRVRAQRLHQRPAEQRCGRVEGRELAPGAAGAQHQRLRQRREGRVQVRDHAGDGGGQREAQLRRRAPLAPAAHGRLASRERNSGVAHNGNSSQTGAEVKSQISTQHFRPKPPWRRPWRRPQSRPRWRSSSSRRPPGTRTSSGARRRSRCACGGQRRPARAASSCATSRSRCCTRAGTLSLALAAARAMSHYGRVSSSRYHCEQQGGGQPKRAARRGRAVPGQVGLERARGAHHGGVQEPPEPGRPWHLILPQWFSDGSLERRDSACRSRSRRARTAATH